MAILSWGKCFISHATSIDGVPTSAWGGIDTPKENSTKLNTSAGVESTLNREGGEAVAARLSRNAYQLEFDIFVKKGRLRPFSDDDGNIVGEHAFRVNPIGENCEGIQIDRCALIVEESYSTSEGIMLHYVAKVLKPAEGKSIKPYTGAKSMRLYQSDAVRMLENETMRLC